VVTAFTTWITPAAGTSKRIRIAGIIPGEGIAMNSEILAN
jgi:hypothetical protein